MAITEIRRVMEKVIEETPLTPHQFLENMVPVANGARPSSLTYLDMLDMTKIRVESKAQVMAMYPLLKQKIRDLTGLQVTMLFDPTIALVSQGRGQAPRMVFYMQTEVGERLKALQKKYIWIQGNWSKVTDKDYYPAIEEEGDVAGIPKCCTSEFSINRRLGNELRKIGIDQESIIQRAVRAAAPRLEDVARLPPETLQLFWANEVYPCSLNCAASRERGRQILDCFGDARVAQIYQDVIMTTNAERVHSPEVILRREHLDSKKADYSLWNRRILDAFRSREI